MVAAGLAMFAVGLWSLWLRARGKLYAHPWFFRACVLLSPAGIVAVIAGWVTTEVGRQPYTIYGVLTTAESVSSVAAEAVGASLAAFVVIYFSVFGAGAFYMLRLMNKVPDGHRGRPAAAGTDACQRTDAGARDGADFRTSPTRDGRGRAWRG